MHLLHNLRSYTKSLTNKCDLKRTLKKSTLNTHVVNFLLSCSATYPHDNNFYQFNDSERKLNVVAKPYKTHQTDKLTIEWVKLDIVYYAPIYCFILDFFSCFCR